MQRSFPPSRAAFLTVDGVGEWTTTSHGMGIGSQIEMLGELHFPHSLRLLYSAFTTSRASASIPANTNSWASRPTARAKIRGRHLREADGSPGGWVVPPQHEVFNYGVGLTMAISRFAKLFGRPPRKPESS